MITKFSKTAKKLRLKYWSAVSLLALATCSNSAFADDTNPFPNIGNGGDNGNIVQTAGTTMESAMKYLSIGLGGLLILICLGVIIHRMREDSREKDHGNLIMTYVLCALGMTLGFVLIGIGWKAFNTQIN